MAGSREFDKDRFKQLVVYISWATRNDQRFGRTKLAKTLFYLDFDAYATEGQSVTGARYEHWEHGPFPPVLYRVEEELEAEGLAERLPPLDKRSEIKLRVVKEPELKGLTWERHAADAVIQRIAAQPTWRVEDESHEHPGWRVTRLFEEIPYAGSERARRVAPVHHAAALSVCAGPGALVLPLSGPRLTTPA
jgi:uncharacterized phage-associated protein